MMMAVNSLLVSSDKVTYRSQIILTYVAGDLHLKAVIFLLPAQRLETSSERLESIECNQLHMQIPTVAPPPEKCMQQQS